MKFYSKLLSVLAVAAIFASCDKKDSLTSYTPGNAPQLKSSTLSVAPIAADSNNTVISFNWTDPRYSINGNTKYVLEIDSVTKGFSNPYRREMTGQNTTSIIAKDLNTWMLSRGYAFNVPVSLEARVVSSYTNNNERLSSNVLPIRATPYKTPPRVAVPTSGKLFLVGSASQGGWTNPVPVPAQEFSQLDATTWAGIFQLNGGQEYLVLPENGNWAKKYAMSDNTVAGAQTSGTFGYHVDGQPAPDIYTQNFKGPATSGLYRIELDFQTGRYSVTPWKGMLADNFYIVGAATPNGWNNNSPAPANQTFTRINSSEYTLTLPLVGGQEYLILPVAGSWDQKYALQDNGVAGITTGGQFGYHDNTVAGGTFDANFKAPATSGTYTIKLNLAAKTTPGSNASGTFKVQ
jgi:hypothetical protein